jgi:hypothetical protein
MKSRLLSNADPIIRLIRLSHTRALLEIVRLMPEGIRCEEACCIERVALSSNKYGERLRMNSLEQHVNPRGNETACDLGTDISLLPECFCVQSDPSSVLKT